MSQRAYHAFVNYNLPFLLFLFQPDRPFHNFRASQSVDRQTCVVQKRRSWDGERSVGLMAPIYPSQIEYWLAKGQC